MRFYMTAREQCSEDPVGGAARRPLAVTFNQPPRLIVPSWCTKEHDPVLEFGQQLHAHVMLSVQLAGITCCGAPESNRYRSGDHGDWVEDRKLVIDETEAREVRLIFELDSKLKSVPALIRELDS